MAEAKKKLGEILLEAGVIDKFQLKSALAEQNKWGGRLGNHLVQMGILTEELLVKALSKQLKIPYLDLSQMLIVPETLALVPQELAEKFHLVPVAVKKIANKKTLIVAMSDPTNLDAIDELQFRTGHIIKPAVDGDTAIEMAIRHYYYGESGPSRRPNAPLEMSAPGAPQQSNMPASHVPTPPEATFAFENEPTVGDDGAGPSAAPAPVAVSPAARIAPGPAVMSPVATPGPAIAVAPVAPSMAPGPAVMAPVPPQYSDPMAYAASLEGEAPPYAAPDAPQELVLDNGQDPTAQSWAGSEPAAEAWADPNAAVPDPNGASLDNGAAGAVETNGADPGAMTLEPAPADALAAPDWGAEAEPPAWGEPPPVETLPEAEAIPAEPAPEPAPLEPPVEAWTAPEAPVESSVEPSLEPSMETPSEPAPPPGPAETAVAVAEAIPAWSAGDAVRTGFGQEPEQPYEPTTPGEPTHAGDEAYAAPAELASAVAAEDAPAWGPAGESAPVMDAAPAEAPMEAAMEPVAEPMPEPAAEAAPAEMPVEAAASAPEDPLAMIPFETYEGRAIRALAGILLEKGFFTAEELSARLKALMSVDPAGGNGNGSAT